MSGSYSECPLQILQDVDFFVVVWFGLVNTMTLNFPRASKYRIALEQFGTCLNLNSLELIYDKGKSYSPKALWHPRLCNINYWKIYKHVRWRDPLEIGGTNAKCRPSPSTLAKMNLGPGGKWRPCWVGQLPTIAWTFCALTFTPFLWKVSSPDVEGI